MRSSGKIHIGTSGWHYRHWRGPWYPTDLPSVAMLPFYTQVFQSVEINNSFYRLPSHETFEMWRDSAPPGFVFAVKASRFLTHMKKLKDPAEPVQRLLDRTEVLGDRLGPYLYQLPPRWRADRDRLSAFLSTLPERHRHAFEFRDPSWFTDRVYELLHEHNAAFCIYDLNGQVSPPVVTADFVYIRLHGPGRAYEGSYSEQALEDWARAMIEWSGAGCDVYCYFDNDQAGYAPKNAARLLEILRQRVP